MQSFCARGNTSSELYYDYFSNITNNYNYFEHGEYSTSRVQFKSHEVIMDSINIELQAKGKDMFSSFEIMMWLPQNKNDTVESVEKSFLHGKITLMNGEVVGTGVFKDLSLRVRKSNEGIYTVVVQNFKAIGELPEGITNENSTIEVVTMSDGGIDEENAISNALNDSSLTADVFPNPTSDILNISLSSIDPSENYSIILYDLKGKTISTIESNISSKNLSNYQINLSEKIEIKGMYYILIKSNNGKQNILQKIVYQ